MTSPTHAPVVADPRSSRSRPSRTGRTLAVLGLAILAIIAFAGWWLMSSLPGPEGLQLTVDGETVEVSGLTGFWPVDLVVGVVSVAVALLAVFVVVPLALLVGLGTPLLVLGGLVVLALLAVGLVAFVALSPLLLIALVIWWIARGRRPRPSTTIAA